MLDQFFSVLQTWSNMFLAQLIQNNMQVLYQNVKVQDGGYYSEIGTTGTIHQDIHIQVNDDGTIVCTCRMRDSQHKEVNFSAMGEKVQELIDELEEGNVKCLSIEEDGFTYTTEPFTMDAFKIPHTLAQIVNDASMLVTTLIRRLTAQDNVVMN